MKQYSPHGSTKLWFMLNVKELCWSWHELTYSFGVCSALSLVALGHYEVNALSLIGSKNRRLRLQCGWLYMFTRLLSDYIQYLDTTVILLMYYMLYLLLYLTLMSLLSDCCVCTLLPKPLIFLYTYWLICDWLGYFKLHPVGPSWVHAAVHPTCIHLTWCLMLYFDTYILSITH